MDWKVVLFSFISTLGALSLNQAIAQTTLQSQMSTNSKPRTRDHGGARRSSWGMLNPA